MTGDNIPNPMEHHRLESFTSDGLTRPVYWSKGGARRSVVIVCHEMPGITPEFIGFVQFLEMAGFATVVPHLFGEVGRRMTVGYLVRTGIRVCIAREFHVLAGGHASPIAGWLRALAREASIRHDVGRVGAIGMCFTGNFAIGMLLEPVVTRAVASQPSLPFAVWPGLGEALHQSPDETARLAARLGPDGDAQAMALRFSGDRLCPAARFANLQSVLGGGLETIVIDSGRGNAHGIKRLAHSVLTIDLVDDTAHPTYQARERVLSFLSEGLRTQTTP
jgi:dienelactone hydrolase